MPLPRFTHMPLARLHAPFDHPDWLFELKYDGFRAHAYINSGICDLVSRNRNTYKSFRKLCLDIAGTIPRKAVLDGEIVHLDSSGRPQFYSLMRRAAPQHFVAFDLLWLDGKDLRHIPLIERKAYLRQLIPHGSPILFADYVERDGSALFHTVCERDLEGIVAKRKRGLYTPEETSWVKIKNPSYSQAVNRYKLFEKRVRAVGAG